MEFAPVVLAMLAGTALMIWRQAVASWLRVALYRFFTSRYTFGAEDRFSWALYACVAALKPLVKRLCKRHSIAATGFALITTTHMCLRDLVRREVMSLDQARKISQSLGCFSVDPSQFHSAKGLADNQVNAHSRAAHLQRMQRHQQRIRKLLSDLYSAGPVLDAVGQGENARGAVLKSTDYCLSLYKGLRTLPPVAAAFALFAAEICEAAVRAQLMAHENFRYWVGHEVEMNLTPEAIANTPPGAGTATPAQDKPS